MLRDSVLYLSMFSFCSQSRLSWSVTSGHSDHKEMTFRLGHCVMLGIVVQMISSLSLRIFFGQGCSFFHSILRNPLFPLSNRLFSKFLNISAKCYDNRKHSVGFHNW